MPVGGKLTVRWLEMDEVESPKDDLRQRGFAKGAARFARGEGMYAEGSIYFACTNGGAKKRGRSGNYRRHPRVVCRAERQGFVR